MKLKNKFFIILLSLILVLFTFTLNSFASVDFTYNDISYSLPNLPDTNNYILIHTYPGDNIYMLTSTEEIIIDGTYVKFLADTNIYRYNSSSFSWTLTDVQTASAFSTFNGLNKDSLIFSNFDILNKKGDVVFPAAPLLQETILAPIVEQVEMKTVTQEILGILPIVLIILVSLIAFYKGLSMVRRILRQS